jgi:hypothetical protein
MKTQLLFSNFVLSAATALESNLGRGIVGVGIVLVCVAAVFCCGTSASGKLISTSRKHSLPKHFILSGYRSSTKASYDAFVLRGLVSSCIRTYMYKPNVSSISGQWEGHSPYT